MAHETQKSMRACVGYALALAVLFSLGIILIGTRAEATGYTVDPSNRVNFKLRVVAQVPAVENPANVFTYNVIQLKFTNKEMLKTLSRLYPGAALPGTRLVMTDQGYAFALISPNGSAQVISTAHLNAITTNGVHSEVDNSIKGTFHQREAGAATLMMNLDANNLFNLQGGFVTQINVPPSRETTLLKLGGNGKLNGYTTQWSGTISSQFRVVLI